MNHCEPRLTSDLVAVRTEIHDQRTKVCVLEQAGTVLLVDPDRDPNDFVREAACSVIHQHAPGRCKMTVTPKSKISGGLQCVRSRKLQLSSESTLIAISILAYPQAPSTPSAP